MERTFLSLLGSKLSFYHGPSSKKIIKPCSELNPLTEGKKKEVLLDLPPRGRRRQNRGSLKLSAQARASSLTRGKSRSHRRDGTLSDEAQAQIPLNTFFSEKEKRRVSAASGWSTTI